MTLQPARTVAELQELRSMTGTAAGAQRVCWTDVWAESRAWLRNKLAELPVQVETDEAGNLWATLVGESERAVVIGGHMDSVPDGGWLDGCLNTLAGLESLRRISAEGKPPVTVRLVDWADEEGARFGRSLLGSSACAGILEPDEVRELRDRGGVSLPDALLEHGVGLATMEQSRSQLESAAAYLELHIEQGPVLERLDLPLGAVLGTFGVERHLIRFTGQAAHSGSTPMADRRDSFAGAARFALEVHEHTRQTGQGAVSTTGSVAIKPGIVTAVAGECEITLDQRHLEAAVLAGELAAARAASERIAEEERLDVEWEELWTIDPIPFDERLIDLADEAITEVAGTSHRLPSGPLHDAASVALAEIPTVMLFAQSLRGLSHTKEEDTKLEHLELSVAALDRLASKTIDLVASS
ncbi:MAG: Zn-dependent hydrolase [Gaiellaceae bacterium]